MVSDILTVDEVRSALNLDFNYPDIELQELATSASSFIYQKTKYDFGADVDIHPLAKKCARALVKDEFFGSNDFNREHDYSLGINGMIVDLQNIARVKKLA